MPTDFPQKKTSYSNNNEKKNKYINKENINYVSDPKKCPQTDIQRYSKMSDEDASRLFE